MSYSDMQNVQFIIGGKLITDPYPYHTADRTLWVNLLTDASFKGIGLYGALTYIRAIGAKLEPNEKFGYVIKPLLRDGSIKWGWASMEQYNEAKKLLVPYSKPLMELLRNLKWKRN